MNQFNLFKSKDRSKNYDPKTPQYTNLQALEDKKKGVKPSTSESSLASLSSNVSVYSSKSSGNPPRQQISPNPKGFSSF